MKRRLTMIALAASGLLVCLAGVHGIASVNQAQPAEVNEGVIEGADEGIVKGVPEGKVYLKNVESGLWLGAANNWGTRASLVPHAEFVYIAQQDGAYTIETQVSNGGESYYFGGEWMDGEITTFNIAPSGNYFTIANADGEFFGTADDVLVNGTQIPGWGVSGNAALWQIFTEDEMMATLNRASATSPVDATFLIMDHTFGRNNRNVDAWQVSADCSNISLTGGNSQKHCAESYHSVFTVLQNIYNVPNGTYALTAQGFYRQDGADSDNLPEFFANNQTAQLPLLRGGENSMYDACETFEAGLYKIEPITFVVTDGTITLGVQNPNNSGLWVIWDNFELTYYGGEVDPNIDQTIIPRVLNGSFANNRLDKWTVEGGIPDMGYGCAQFYETNGDIYQQFTNVRKGLYLLQAQAFYRTGENSAAWAERFTAPIKSFLYANDKQVAVKNVMSQTLDYRSTQYYGYSWFDVTRQVTENYNDNDQYVPNDMWSGNRTFNDYGLYKNKLYVFVDDETLRIGLRSEGEVSYRWTMMDNFILTYFTEADVNALVDNLLAVEGQVTAAQKDALDKLKILKDDGADYDALGKQIADMGDLDELQEVAQAYAALKAAIDNLTAAAANAQSSPELLAEVQALLKEVQANYNDGKYTKEEALAMAEHLISYIERLGYTFFDVTINADGSLGDSILAHFENFNDLQSLKIRGKLGAEDVTTLHNLIELRELDMSELSWTTIPGEQFRYKNILQRVALPKDVQTIGAYAFSECTSLKVVDFPQSLRTIGYSAFSYTHSLDNVVLNEGLSSIDGYAFYNSYLKSLTLPSTLKTVPYSCFSECDYLMEVNFNGQEVLENEAFYSCDRLTSLKMPATLQTIRDNAFYYAWSLTNLELNEGLTTIGYHAFGDCDNLRSVTLPSTLLYASGRPFYSCDNLTEVTCLAIATPFVDGSNIMSQSGRTLYVPQLSVNVYKQADGWSQFNIVGIDVMPENIVILTPYKLNWPDNLSIDYKPNVSIARNANNNTYGSLQVNGSSTLSANEFRMIYDPNINYDKGGYYDNDGRYRRYRDAYAALVNNANVRADNVVIELWQRDRTWDFITLPFDVKVGDIRPNFEGTPLVIRKYDGQNRAQGLISETWVDMPADSILHAGEGYIWQSASTDGNRHYTGFYIDAQQTANKNNIFANGDIEVPLNYYESEFAHNRSWNLIGNPYPCFYDIRAMLTSAPITVWDTYYQNYEAFSPLDDAYILNPGQAFFVQRPIDEESIKFRKEGRQANTTVRDIDYNNSSRAMNKGAQRSVFNLLLSQGNQSDRTRFVINAEAKMDYESARDANKFMSLEQGISQLYTMRGNVRYAINERPLANGEIQLGMMLSNDGIYTLKLDTRVENEVFLVDLLTGTEVRLDGQQEGYTFEAKAGTLENRFVIRLGQGQTTGINMAGVKSQEGNAYNLGGQRVDVDRQKGVIIHNGKKVVK